MALDRYREVLALPGVRGLFLVALLARVPFTAAGVTLTLLVVLGLDRGYAAAGAVTTATTIGAAVGSPLLGRGIDRYGLRPVLVVTALASAVFWGTAVVLPYAGLLPAAFVGGLSTVPVFAVVRQAVAALMPGERRRAAYALDSVGVELAFMTGPALAVLLATTVAPQVAVAAVGAAMVAGGAALLVLDPPVRGGDPAAPGTAPDTSAPGPRGAAQGGVRRVAGPLAAVLAVTAATTCVLIGIDLSIVAALREAGQVSWTSLVLVLWAAYSLTGGLLYGAAPRAVPPVVLLTVLAAGVLPAALVAGASWWLLAAALVVSGLVVAPTLTAATERVSQLAPAAARGEAMGWHHCAMTVGVAVGAPFTGAVLDRTSAGGGFAAVAAVGLLAAAAMWGWRRGRRLLVPVRRSPVGRRSPVARRLVPLVRLRGVLAVFRTRRMHAAPHR